MHYRGDAGERRKSDERERQVSFRSYDTERQVFLESPAALRIKLKKF